jgi:dolichol-phosphate mannosyltransferase
MTEGPPPRCSVVMPAYNEEGAIAEAVTDIRTHVLAVVPDAEILVVNDGSKDRTGVVLDTLATQEPRLRVLHKPNGGHGSAVIAGADAARGDWLFFIDSDRQIPLDGFGAAWRAVEAGADAAFGVRRRRHDPRLRLWLTMVIRHALRGLLGVRLYDANVPTSSCGARPGSTRAGSSPTTRWRPRCSSRCSWRGAAPGSPSWS